MLAIEPDSFYLLPRSELRPDETRTVTPALRPWAGSETDRWISADDHIHLTRSSPASNLSYLRWLEADDLTVGNFLALQRQMDAAPQYGYGPAAEARRGPYTIRSGQELRDEFWGHILILGQREMIRPMSTGRMYANTPESYPFPSLLFARGRQVGGLTGYAHFFQKPQRSTLYLDAALGNIDFVEVFQFGELKTAEWYELLNAGLRVTGIAGSDFPVPFGRLRPWPRWLPLLGPERALARKAPGGPASSYEQWAEAVRQGRITVSNGPLVELEFDAASGRFTATASFWRPLEALEIVRNGEVIAAARGGPADRRLTASGVAECADSCWLAARTRAVARPGEPLIQAHTNPTYLLRGNRPVRVEASLQSLRAKWEDEIAYYRSAPIVFPSGEARREFFAAAERALERLR